MINKVRVLAIAVAIMAGAVSFAPVDAEANTNATSRLSDVGASFICISDPQVCFRTYDDEGNETGHRHGIPSGHQ